MSGTPNPKPQLKPNHAAKMREARRTKLINTINDISVFPASGAGSILRKVMPDALEGGESVTRLTWPAVLSALVIGVAVVAFREYYGKVDHKRRRQRIGKRIVEAIVIGYLGVDLIPYVLEAATKLVG